MRRFWVYALYAVLTAAVTSLGTYLTVSFVVERAPEAAVPAVAGLGLAQALDVLDSHKLDLEVGEFEYSDTVPENHVIRQRPEAGRVVKAGRGVRVILSRGAERHPVPDVAGLPLDEARIALAEAGLTGQVVGRVAGGREGQVLAQGAAPGTRLLKGTPLGLLLSSGAPLVRYRMPRVEGMPLDRAVELLDAIGVRVEKVDEVAVEKPEQQGLVLGQEPAAGSPVARGGGVLLAASPRREEPAAPAEEPKSEP